ncbi:hypothetical protein R1flu_013424 [Riccia fluitans]|uniref:Uncharacterized protein n=1 Tax=Riccia fluitans TaxID=41844 RepID=A0ABD1YDC3_9MARC
MITRAKSDLNSQSEACGTQTDDNVDAKGEGKPITLMRPRHNKKINKVQQTVTMRELDRRTIGQDMRAKGWKEPGRRTTHANMDKTRNRIRDRLSR